MNNIFVLIKKDIISVLRSKSVYLFLLISSYLYGSSFLTAVDLYAKASVTAIDNPLYSKGFEPVFGVFVPAFGGLFLSFTLLLPLCIIPLFSEERKNNTIVLLYQNGYRDYHLLMSKLVSSFSVLPTHATSGSVYAIDGITFGSKKCCLPAMMLTSNILEVQLYIPALLNLVPK